jgi:hypothetical protein
MAGTNTNINDELDRLSNALVINNGIAINTGELQNDEEIKQLMEIAYEMADELSPTGQRTPFDIEMIETKRKQLEEELRQRTEEKEEDQKHRDAWQGWAEQQRKKRELSLKIEQMNRLQEALKKPEVKDLLKNPEVTDLLLKVMNHQFTPQQAFKSINAIPNLKKQMLSLTSKGTRTGGKSRIFRRKNKKMTSTSRRKVRGTRRHRKSSTRRSTRK